MRISLVDRFCFRPSDIAEYDSARRPPRSRSSNSCLEFFKKPRRPRQAVEEERDERAYLVAPTKNVAPEQAAVPQPPPPYLKRISYRTMIGLDLSHKIDTVINVSILDPYWSMPYKKLVDIIATLAPANQKNVVHTWALELMDRIKSDPARNWHSYEAFQEIVAHKAIPCDIEIVDCMVDCIGNMNGSFQVYSFEKLSRIAKFQTRSFENLLKIARYVISEEERSAALAKVAASIVRTEKASPPMGVGRQAKQENLWFTKFNCVAATLVTLPLDQQHLPANALSLVAKTFAGEEREIAHQKLQLIAVEPQRLPRDEAVGPEFPVPLTMPAWNSFFRTQSSLVAIAAEYAYPAYRPGTAIAW